MKTTAHGELTVGEIREAIAFWLETRSDIKVNGEIHFRVEGLSEPDDWRAEYDLSYELVGAYFDIKVEGK